jgi:RNA-binding protein 5/10
MRSYLRQHDNRFDNYDSNGGNWKNSNNNRREHNDHDDRFGDVDQRRRSRSRSRSNVDHTNDYRKNNNFERSYQNHRNNRNNDSKRHHDDDNNSHSALYANVQPSRTIMLRHIPLTLDEQELKTEFNMAMVPFRDVRLVRHRDTGQSRGFGFLEFASIEESKRWMEYTQVSALLSILTILYTNKVWKQRVG